MASSRAQCLISIVLIIIGIRYRETRVPPTVRANIPVAVLSSWNSYLQTLQTGYINTQTWTLNQPCLNQNLLRDREKQLIITVNGCTIEIKHFLFVGTDTINIEKKKHLSESGCRSFLYLNEVVYPIIIHYLDMSNYITLYNQVLCNRLQCC